MKDFALFMLMLLMFPRNDVNGDLDASDNLLQLGGDDDDLGLIIYVENVRVGKSIMQDLCSVVNKAYKSMSCESVWSDGAFVKANEGYTILEEEKESVVDLLQDELSLTHQIEGATVHLEPNLEVVEGGDLLTQEDAPLNLGRLDQAENEMDHTYSYMTTGKGVTVYVLDKGINMEHIEFNYRDGTKGSRVKHGTRTFSSDPSCAGHGTHVAGIVGGLKYGVAKDVEIVMVQVQPCKEKGSVQFLLSGMDWLLENVKRPAVVQMSLLALGTSESLNKKVDQIIDDHIPFVLSAGNYANDACLYSPAMVDRTIVVGNVEADDTLNKYSNYGKCVDIFAPGASIRSASSTSNTLEAVMTGTSQAAPHVSGVVAQYLEREPYATEEDVLEKLLETAAEGYIKDPKGSPNYLLQTDLSPVIETVTATISVPSLFLSPKSLAPINLYQSSKGDSATTTVSIANQQGGLLNYNITIKPVGSGQVHEWLSTNRTSGSLSSGVMDTIHLFFTNKEVQQGIYTADVQISSSDPDKPLYTLRATMRNFCGRVQSHINSTVAEFHKVNLTAGRPHHWEPEAHADDQPSLYLEGLLALAYPVIYEDPESLLPQMPGAISVKGGGYVDLVQSVKIKESLCSLFKIRARAPRHDVWSGGNNMCIQIKDRKIKDVNGFALPGATLCSAHDAEPEAKLFGAHLTYSSDEGLYTSESEVTVLAAFSEVVVGVGETQVSVEISDEVRTEAPTIKLLEGATTVYQFVVSLPNDYSGFVKVSLGPGISDTTGNKLKTPDPLRFKKSRATLLSHSSFRIRDEM